MISATPTILFYDFKLGRRALVPTLKRKGLILSDQRKQRKAAEKYNRKDKENKNKCLLCPVSLSFTHLKLRFPMSPNLSARID